MSLIKKYNFEQQSTRFKNFQGDISSKENDLIDLIVAELTEDIFNKAFANW